MNPIDVKVILNADEASREALDSRTDWIVVFSYPPEARQFRRFPYGELLLARHRKVSTGRPDTEPAIADLPNTAGTRVVFAVLRPDSSTFELLTLARKLAAACGRRHPETIALVAWGFDPAGTERVTEALLAAVLAAAARMPSYKRKPDRRALKRVEVHGCRPAHGFRRTRAEADGNALARYLSLLPPNRLTPADYLKLLRELAQKRRWQLEFMDVKALARKKAGAFLAVAQGSPSADAGIVRLRYRPSGAGSARRPVLALVGKGICFDTGGVNLKTQRHMFGMHGDMQGSAVAVGVLQALAELKYPNPVECWLALATNHIGPRSYKPNDVVTAADGTSIEVVHTDAEGRMVLADTLALAARIKPGLVIDFATLTGSCIQSLGSAYSGVFTNREQWIPRLVDCGRSSGERVWPFPLDEDYDEELESEIADIRQCAMAPEADHILAARFLRRFIGEDIPWVHVDLSASTHKNGLAHVPTEMTGFGVRFALEFVLEGQAL
jgi:leucyl aminopeptidase